MPTPREAWQNSVQRQGYGGERLRASDFGSGGEAIGRAAQGFGQDLKQVGAQIEKIRLEDAETAAREADNIRMKKRLDRFYGENGFFNKEGRAAVEDREALDEDLRRIDEGVEPLLKGKPLARQLFADITTRRNMDDMPRIAIHTSKERVKWDDQVDATATNEAINAASLSKDPVAIEKNIDTVKAIAVRRAQRKGITDEIGLKHARQAATAVAVEAIAGQLERQSPGEAQAFIMTHAPNMDPQDVAKLLNGVDDAAEQERAGSDIGQFIAYKDGAGVNPPPDGSQETSAGPTPIPPDAALDAAQFTAPNSQESGGKHIDPKTGKLLESSAGALGISQTMIATGYTPGYGVKPLQNQSREEYLRFGRDYRNAMIKHFGGNVVLGLTAYNWGPGNVEAHLKKIGYVAGQTSDAAFINSIPVKEAREYAPAVLSKAGVSVSGVAGPSAGQPVQVGREVDITTTINNIRNSDRTWRSKQALIAEATRLHGYGRQAKAESEAQLRDELYTSINNLPVDGFTSINQLPLELRNRLQLPQYSELYNSARNMAQANHDRKQAEIDDKKAAVFKEKLALLEQDLMAYMWQDPEGFKKLNFYGSPKWANMGSERVTYWMKQQQSLIESGAGKGANHDSIRAMVNRYATTAEKGKHDQMGLYYREAVREEERLLSAPGRNGKPLTDTEREGIVVRLMQDKVKYTIDGKTRTGTMAEAKAAGAQTATIRGKDLREYLRAEYQKRHGVVPSEQQVDAFVRDYVAATGGN